MTVYLHQKEMLRIFFFFFKAYTQCVLNNLRQLGSSETCAELHIDII